VVGGGKLTITGRPARHRTAAGVGFTVSFLIASLAFTGTELDEAKVGVLDRPAVVAADRRPAGRSAPVG